MNRVRTTSIGPRSILVVVIVCFLTIAVIAIALAAPVKGSKAPDIKLTLSKGKTVTLKDLQKDPAKKGANRVLLIDFWATWCPPCRAAVPELQKLYKKYGKQGFAVIGIAQDSEGAAKVKPFVQEQKLTYPMFTDESGAVARQYGVRYLPTAFLVDRKGVIHEVYTGFAPGTEKDIEKEIKALLK